ncbi:PIR protein, putative [Plasmodium sp.]|nr:PIR protein, putative [Plasmodium sp.]
MNVHCINILLFAVPLNILANTHKKPSITPRHIQTNRLLCECELFAPQNYDNDPEMKRVMQQFHDRTTQRFQEYDESLHEKRQVCKDTCDKEIQKIILKDKLEKELTEKFATLQTDIHSDAIPTCICEKSMADKVEKACLKCTQNLGGIVAPSLGVLGGIPEGALSVWKPAALKLAFAAAKKAGAAAGKIAGDAKHMEVVIESLKILGVEDLIPGIYDTISSTSHYANVSNISHYIYAKFDGTCLSLSNSFSRPAACTTFEYNFGIFTKGSNIPGPPAIRAIPNMLNKIAEKAELSAKAAAKISAKEATEAAIETNTGAIQATTTTYYTAIIAAVVAIVVIVLIMLIIYLILRYLRKKKMKKKLQYIKLLEE